ncbi:MAG: MraY family glycosyltransferase [Balneolales bacterium]
MTQESYLVMWIFFSGLVFTLLIALLLTPIVRELAQRFNFTDEPGGRKIHKKPMPNIGGVAIVGVFFIGLGYFALIRTIFNLPEDGIIQLPSIYILSGGLVMAATGLYDDIYTLGFKKKFMLQIAVSFLVIGGGYQIEALQNPFTGAMFDLGILGIPITVFVVVGIINAVNLLDGMDGLAAGVTLISFVSLSAAYGISGRYEHLVLVVIISGALLAFLRYNFNPASIFMGDTGSLFIGFLLATYALGGMNNADSMLAFLIPVVCMGLPILDTGLAILRRFLERKPLFSPDSDHIHHRVARKFGFTHRRTVIILYLASIFLGIMAFLMAMTDDVLTTLVLCSTALVSYYFLKMLGYIPFKKSSSLESLNMQSTLNTQNTEVTQKDK